MNQTPPVKNQPPAREKKKRIFVAEDTILQFLSVPKNFAPSKEKCSIRYRLQREGDCIGKMAKLIIMDNQGKTLYSNEYVGLAGDGDFLFDWDGKTADGKFAGPMHSPLKVSLSMTNKPLIKAEQTITIEVKKIDVWVDGSNDKLLMDNPENKMAVYATVFLKKTDGTAVITEISIPVQFTFSDPAPANTLQAKSFKYSSAPDKFLGKKNDPNAVYWEACAGTTVSSTDGFKTKCQVTTKTSGADTGKANVYFKPSGVGGDTLKITVSILSSDNATVLFSHDSNVLTVWRSVTFDKIYEMIGETHVSTNATAALISPVYNPAYVQYKVGPRTEIADPYNVKYIGLWKDSTTPQKSWATIKQKKPDETPTAQEITDATYVGANAALIAKRGIAQAAIKTKAQKWADRIDSDFHTAMPKWVTDASIPSNALVAIKYYHPKYSPDAGEATTTEWNLGGAATPAWIRVDVFPKSGGGHYYTGLDPDGQWTSWAGLSHGSGIVTVPKGNPSATVQQVVKHEAGHATQSHFKRQDFGPSLDHSASKAGIMYYSTDGGTTFTNREKKILRGIKP